MATERTGSLRAAPAPSPSDEADLPHAEGRRWNDRPGRIPALTFARYLTTTPDLREVAPFLVGLLAWPLGATGVFIVRDHGDAIETIARYDEQIDGVNARILQRVFEDLYERERLRLASSVVDVGRDRTAEIDDERRRGFDDVAESVQISESVVADG